MLLLDWASPEVRRCCVASLTRQATSARSPLRLVWLTAAGTLIIISTSAPIEKRAPYSGFVGMVYGVAAIAGALVFASHGLC